MNNPNLKMYTISIIFCNATHYTVFTYVTNVPFIIKNQDPSHKILFPSPHYICHRLSNKIH